MPDARPLPPERATLTVIFTSTSGMQMHRHRMQAQLLDRMDQHDLIAQQREAASRRGVGDVARRDRAV